MTKVYHVDQPGRVQTFSLTAKEAVLAAYAQSMNDYNHWDYEDKYGHLVLSLSKGYMCGPFWAKDPTKCEKPEGSQRGLGRSVKR
jgi:hypothetical protein